MIGRRTLQKTLAIAMALLAALLPAPASAVPPETEIVIDGGGWGHGIGMPQYGAQGMADQGGFTYDQILSYWYTGIGFGTASGVAGTPVPDPLRIGINYVLVGTEYQYRPFLWQDFTAIGGNVSICLPGETLGGCSFTAAPGETWRYAWNESEGHCEITQNSVSVYQHATDCGVSLQWGGQPDVRVQFPGSDVGRTFARGRVEFIAPVSRQWNGVNRTGFHINIVLSLEEYMYGIAEVPVSWHMEALKAQAVAARTYGAWKSRGGLRSDCSCHLVWDTNDQSYRGWHSLNEGNSTDGHRWRAAVDATAGQVVMYPAGTNNIAETYYFSSSGGATENVWEVWGSGTQYQQQYAYLATKPDPWSALYATTPTEYTSIRWRHTRTAAQIVTALTSGEQPAFGGLTEVIAITVEAHNSSGSPSRIEVKGLVGGQVVTKQFVSRAPAAGEGTIGTLRSRLGLRGHYIYSFVGFLEPERWAGANRYETAAEVSRQTHPDGAEVVYLAVGTNYPDAQAGGPAAAAEGAPILLVQADALPYATRVELQRLAPQTVVVLGGPAAIADSVLTEVSNTLPAAGVTRRAGANRYATAVEISKAAFPDGATTVFVATGENFPDALVAAPAAIAAGGPLLLVPSGSLPSVVATEIQRLAPDRIVVVGGTVAVSPSVFTALQPLAPTVERIEAPDRYQLSAAVSAATFPADTSTLYVAVGTDFPDALAGGPATYLSPGPVLLVKTGELPTAVIAELTRIGPRRIVILGGTAVVSTAVAESLADFMR
ncbi:MAG: cell wall-binding repeat-containing protein [Acidimicrobiia bacterium]|nr:MAG: cell wall-binding repeat-containing protein [Acidimicrobiia bacterium]